MRIVERKPDILQYYAHYGHWATATYICGINQGVYHRYTAHPVSDGCTIDVNGLWVVRHESFAQFVINYIDHGTLPIEPIPASEVADFLHSLA